MTDMTVHEFVWRAAEDADTRAEWINCSRTFLRLALYAMTCGRVEDYDDFLLLAALADARWAMDHMAIATIEEAA